MCPSVGPLLQESVIALRTAALRSEWSPACESTQRCSLRRDYPGAEAPWIPLAKEAEELAAQSLELSGLRPALLQSRDIALLPGSPLFLARGEQPGALPSSGQGARSSRASDRSLGPLQAPALHARSPTCV